MGAYSTALLRIRAHLMCISMAIDDAADYQRLKDVLLKNFDIIECGFRKKFC